MRLFRFLCLRRPVKNFDPELEPREILPWSKAWHNLPDRFVLRKSRKLLYKSYPDPAFKPELKLTHIKDITLDRPWSQEHMSKVSPFDKYTHRSIIEPVPKEEWMWFRGDRVEILNGKDKGKQGYINYVVQERNWVCVEGLNCEYKTMGEKEDYPGMMYMSEEPLLVTEDIALVCPSDEKATKVEWRYSEDGERIRVATRTGYQLPIPTEAYETIDYKTPQGYAENPQKDTLASDVEDITFEPKLCTFEMDIMESQGIKEDRVPQKTYWY